MRYVSLWELSEVRAGTRSEHSSTLRQAYNSILQLSETFSYASPIGSHILSLQDADCSLGDVFGAKTVTQLSISLEREGSDDLLLRNARGVLLFSFPPYVQVVSLAEHGVI